MNKGEVNSKDIAAYIPCYEDRNAVRAIRKDSGETAIQKGIKYVVKDILMECGLDKGYLKRFFSPWGARCLKSMPSGWRESKGYWRAWKQ